MKIKVRIGQRLRKVVNWYIEQRTREGHRKAEVLRLAIGTELRMSRHGQDEPLDGAYEELTRESGDTPFLSIEILDSSEIESLIGLAEEGERSYVVRRAILRAALELSQKMKAAGATIPEEIEAVFAMADQPIILTESEDTFFNDDDLDYLDDHLEGTHRDVVCELLIRMSPNSAAEVLSADWDRPFTMHQRLAARSLLSQIEGLPVTQDRPEHLLGGLKQLHRWCQEYLPRFRSHQAARIAVETMAVVIDRMLVKWRNYDPTSEPLVRSAMRADLEELCSRLARIGNELVSLDEDSG